MDINDIKIAIKSLILKGGGFVRNGVTNGGEILYVYKDYATEEDKELTKKYIESLSEK